MVRLRRSGLGKMGFGIESEAESETGNGGRRWWKERFEVGDGVVEIEEDMVGFLNSWCFALLCWECEEDSKESIWFCCCGCVFGVWRQNLSEKWNYFGYVFF